MILPNAIYMNYVKLLSIGKTDSHGLAKCFIYELCQNALNNYNVFPYRLLIFVIILTAQLCFMFR